jgi:hypothetical protein
MKFTVDRIEGDIAVCEDENREMHDIAVSEFLFEIKEGMRFEVLEGQYVQLENEQTERIKKLMKDLWK